MSRIKKRGLDYFPMDTDFIQDRSVRRIMKQEGDGATAVLFNVFSYIYGGEGYFVRADALFYEDVAANLFEKSVQDVTRIICLAVEYGMFDASLFSRYGVLTSAEIQRQYLFSTRRRRCSQIDAAYCLLSEVGLDGPLLSKSNKQVEETANGKPAKEEPEKKEPAKKKRETEMETETERETDTETETEKAVEIQKVTFNPENVTSGTHSIAQNSIAEHSKELPLPVPPGGKDAGAAGRKEEAWERRKEIFSEKPEAGCPTRRKAWTQETIAALQPPADGIARNYEGLLCNLLLYRVPPAEQYAIIRKSNYGIIGDPVWKGFSTLRASCGKIKLPGRYLLSVMNAGT